MSYGYTRPHALRAATVAVTVTLSLALPSASLRGASARQASLRGASAGQAQTFDRKQIPKPGPTPQLQVPKWTTAKLANGAMLIVSERHDLPLVSFSMTFLGGTNQFDPADKPGVGSFTVQMLREGTKTRDGEKLSLDLQLLGTNVSPGIGGESGAVSFLSTADKFAPTLEIMADMLVNSTFPGEALERLRQQRLVQLAQANAQPGVIGNRVFQRVIYGPAHPFARFANEGSVKAITRDDVVAFNQAYYQPGRALIIVVGDVDPATVKSTIEKALAGWKAGGDKPSFNYPPSPAPKAAAIYLVDRPGSKQSSFNIGLAGPPRNTPDYVALQVMNFILGGHFQSRLNANIREEKGYSYGVGSGFAFGKGPGPFRASGDIVSDKTDLALIEFMKELRGIHGGRPITDDEMVQARDSLIQALPAQFASVSAIGTSITNLYVNDLPADYYQAFPKLVSAVTKDDVLRVAKKYIDLEHLNIVIVGDRKSIEEPLKKTGIAPIVVLDAEGDPKK